MKKKLFIIIFTILFPLNVLAYSNKVYVGGDSIGININFEGVLITGFYLENNNHLKIGDYIVKVNNESINSIQDLINKIDLYKNNNLVHLTIKRNNNYFEKDFKLQKDRNIYKTGLYVKDSITGIGTLTYIDPETKIYGSLGHTVLESSTNKRIEVKTGNIFTSYVTTIDKSRNGNPGSKNAKITDNKIGSINKNTNVGIYGIYSSNNKAQEIEIGNIDDFKTGIAYIRTVLNDDDIKEYKINITKIDKNNKYKNIYFKIEDEELLSKSGGVVQGMSGSPIIQNNKLFGAVTHVVIDNVKKGYGVFITTMLEEGDKLLQ